MHNIPYVKCCIKIQLKQQQIGDYCCSPSYPTNANVIVLLIRAYSF